MIEHSDNYSDSLNDKRDELPTNNAELGNNEHKSKSFEYKATLLGETAGVAGGNSFVKNIKVVFH